MFFDLVPTLAHDLIGVSFAANLLTPALIVTCVSLDTEDFEGDCRVKRRDRRLC